MARRKTGRLSSTSTSWLWASAQKKQFRACETAKWTTATSFTLIGMWRAADTTQGRLRVFNLLYEPKLIKIQQIYVQNILNMLHTLRSFSSKCRLFHNATFFGSCVIHILYTECAKIKKKFWRQSFNWLCRAVSFPRCYSALFTVWINRLKVNKININEHFQSQPTHTLREQFY